MNSIPKKPTKSNGHGLYFYPNKGWKIETKVKIDGKFVKLNKGWYRTIAEANADFQNQIELLKERVTPKKEVSRPDIPYEDFREHFLDYRRTKVRGSTLQIDKTRFHSVFDPLFEGMSASQVFKRSSAASVQEKVRSWKANRKNKNKALSQYLDMLEFAFQREYLEDDADYRRCKSEITTIASTEEEDVVSERTVLTSEQCQALLDAIEDAKDKMLTTTLIETGLRFGEAIVLRLSDFNLDKRELYISRTESKDEWGNRKEYHRTKTKLGVRTIPLSDRFASLVGAYCDAMGVYGTDYLFPSEERRSELIEGSAYRRRLAMYCESAGVPRITPHCLRHTFATLLSQRCHSDAERQARAYIMGHSVTVDEEIYTAHNQLEAAKRIVGGKK